MFNHNYYKNYSSIKYKDIFLKSFKSLTCPVFKSNKKHHYYEVIVISLQCFYLLFA